MDGGKRPNACYGTRELGLQPFSVHTRARMYLQEATGAREGAWEGEADRGVRAQACNEGVKLATQ